MRGTVCFSFVRWLVVIVGMCNCLFAVAMMCMPLWWSIVFALACEIIIYWQLRMEMMALALCHVVIDDIVFIAPLYLVINDVL